MGFERDADGFVVGPTGGHYFNEHQVHHYEVLHLCGCGIPEDAYNFCRDVLKCFDRRGGGPWIDAETMVRDLLASKPDVAAHVMAHLLTHLNVLEHGGAVGGSWLTDAGAAIVDLREATENDFDDD